MNNDHDVAIPHLEQIFLNVEELMLSSLWNRVYYE